MRGSREAPIGASRARRSRRAKVPLSGGGGRWRRRVGGIFEGTRRPVGEFVCGQIEVQVARRGASNARAEQLRRGGGRERARVGRPSGGRQIFTPAGAKSIPGGVKLTPGGMERLQRLHVRCNLVLCTILARPKVLVFQHNILASSWMIVRISPPPPTSGDRVAQTQYLAHCPYVPTPTPRAECRRLSLRPRLATPHRFCRASHSRNCKTGSLGGTVMFCRQSSGG